MAASIATPPDVLVAQLAARQHAIVTADQLRACGLSAHAIATRVRRGWLHRRFRGIYAVGHAMLSLHGCFMAAVKACGPDAVLSHFSAAVLHGLLEWDFRAPEVTAPAYRRHRGVRTHRARDVERTHRHGIPVTTVRRTIIDLAAVLTYKELRRLVGEALSRNLIRPSDLLTANHRGAGTLRRVLLTAAPTRSELEDIVRALVEPLPEPEVNRPYLGYVPDLRWPAFRVVVEADGARTHDNLVARADDAERQRVLEEHGELVLRVTWEQAVSTPGRTLRRIEQALRERGLGD